ncbi:hypothetical protein JKP88DRAFT_349321 [Tribonema minus]|uniref:SET domain-containing protein n=1 Tax=Tribonema minus TaxID=303371 RepID=A0A836CC56_9STRA|nr:hypothetical protein JKP88DRAFT_349321 [Tribonema minus]
MVEDTADDAFAKINPNCQDHKGKCSICKKAGVKGQILLECMHSECRVKYHAYCMMLERPLSTTPAFHAYCMMLERPRRTVRCGEHTRPGGRDARRFHYCAKHRKAADALHDKEEWDLDPETDAPPPFSLPFRRRRCARAAAAAAALRAAAAALGGGAAKDASPQKSAATDAAAALAVRGSGSGDSVAAAAGIAAADAAAGSAAPAAAAAAASSAAAATATVTRAHGSRRDAAAAAAAAVLETTAASLSSSDAAAAVARVLAALSDAIDAAPMPGLRHAWAVSCLLALLASDAARAGALGALLLPPPPHRRGSSGAAPSSAAAFSSAAVKEEEEEGGAEAEALLLLRGALLRVDLSLSRAALVGGDRAVADAAVTPVAMGRCPAQLEMAVRACAARAHAARGALSPLVREQQLWDSCSGSSGSGGGAATIKWRGTACVACLEPQGAVPWHHCHMCGVHFHVKCAAKVAHRLKRGVGGGGGGGGDDGGDDGGGGGGGGSGSGGARKYRCRVCAASEALRGAAHRRNLADVYKILRATTCADPAHQPHAGTSILRATTCADPAHQPHPRASVTALHLAARQGWYEGLSLMLHAARVAAGGAGDGVPFGAGAALRGGLPRACLPAAAIPDLPFGAGAALRGRLLRALLPPRRYQKCLTAYDVACEQHDMASAYVLRTTYEGMDPDDRTVLYQWPRGARLGRDISCGLERVPVPWLNEVDDEPFPSDEFTYVTRVIEGRGVVFNWQLASPRAPRPCTCGSKRKRGEDANASPKCGSKRKRGEDASAPCGKDRRKRGEDASAPPKCTGCAAHNQRQSARTECNMLCPCYQVAPSGAVVNCGMRAAQQGVDRQLLVFKHRGVKGWGVRTLEWLPQECLVCVYAGGVDCLVCVYAGEVVTMEEYEERETVYTEQKKGSYGFYCSASHSARTLWVIDATVYRNVGGFLNHACGESNLKMVRVVGECGAATAAPNAGLPAFAPATYALITTRTIERGEELTFHYGDSKMRFEPCFCAPCTRAKQRKDEAAKRRGFAGRCCCCCWLTSRVA